MRLEVVILAAGAGTRLQSRMPKALQPLAGTHLLDHAIGAAANLAPSRIHAVVAPGFEALKSAVQSRCEVNWVTQEMPLGTGHAVLAALPHIHAGALVLVLYVDMPMLREETLRACTAAAGDGVALATAKVPNPGAMGRVVRDSDGNVRAIVEAAEADAETLQIDEVNTGVLSAAAPLLERCLTRLKPHPPKGETYLTDLIGAACEEGIRVRAVACQEAEEALGANTRAELATMERALQGRRARELLAAGVALADPQRINIRGTVTAGMDCWIDVNVILEGEIAIGDGTTIGAGSILRNATLEKDVVIHPYSVIEGAYIGEGARIGPFARIRRQSTIGDHARVGNFVEVKNTSLGAKAKASHLAYLGDGDIGAEANIGAGTVICNFDGKDKHSTVIGRRAFVGSNVTLVAPLIIEEEAFIAAGSTISKPVKAGELAVARTRQRSIRGWMPPWKR